MSTSEILIKSSASFSVAKDLHFGEIFPACNPKVENAIQLLEKAERVSNTELAFLLYVISMESLLSDAEKEVQKTGDIIKLLTSVIDYTKQQVTSEEDKVNIVKKLEELKTVGSRNAVKKRIKQYCPGAKIICNGKETNYTSVYNKCYNIRNDFSHKGIIDKDIQIYGEAIRTIAYDVIAKYASY